MNQNSNGVCKATVAASLPAGAVTFRQKAQTTDHRLLVNAGAPDAGTTIGGVGLKAGILAVTLGPAPAGAFRFRGRAFINGTQYYVTSGTKAFSRDGFSFTSNGDLLVDTT